MKNRDSLLLENCYNKVQGLVQEQMEDREYEAVVDLDYIKFEGTAFDESAHDFGVVNLPKKEKDKLTIKYKIQPNYSQRGIEDISAYGFKLSPFVITKIDEDFKDKAVKKFESVDLSTAEVEYFFNMRKWGEFFPTSIKLVIDKNLNVIPDKCTIEF